MSGLDTHNHRKARHSFIAALVLVVVVVFLMRSVIFYFIMNSCAFVANVSMGLSLC